MASLDNDTRGWIMSGVSGVACVFGACVICIDIIVRKFPGKQDFRIQSSDTFLSSSLSLSFGVLLFSAVYHILPEGKNSLLSGGLSPRAASWALIGCFLGGALAIQVLSRIFHHFMPSHVVGCEHTHDEEQGADHHGHSAHDEHGHGHGHGHGHHSHRHGRGARNSGRRSSNSADSEHRVKMLSESEPLLSRPDFNRPKALTSRVSSFFTGAKTTCDAQGPCYGYSDLCGRECLQSKMRPSSIADLRMPAYGSTGQLMTRSEPDHRHREHESAASGHHQDHSANSGSDGSNASRAASSLAQHVHQTPNDSHDHSYDHDHDHDHEDEPQVGSHHHHVPSNAFLSIGVQTCIGIALHKLPEGFITYATNHANPELGFSIFVALFIHNITEGFALALPLYLALRSRVKAILIASVLGGASQPLGAAVAALCFHVAGSRAALTSDAVYGCMFAITSGTLTSVALQLFSESLGLTHSKTLCLVWAFVGMGILGASSALTA